MKNIELIMGIISAISAWGVLSFLRTGMKKQRTNNTITKTEISKSIIETYPFTQIDKNHKENGIDEKDNWKQFDFYRAIVRKAKGNYLITYTDQCGLTTERNISIKRIYDKDSKFALDVHCHLHNVYPSHMKFLHSGATNDLEIIS
ncbi:hypothetical protein [Nitrosomonas sp. Nm34]|uniref:hypothetical protein n=1 Tax=Nitrosomonas sp. Nm34 TaxID=1881055 RepID=UPI0008DF1F76|nr:hypothetical protein [Nitrosomonas sp. Nm34]SFI98778.1 hypothetical protein SAMN05428978_107411 [Nitrosomonas sp. Nm34]